jgi:hypothetical protein
VDPTAKILVDWSPLTLTALTTLKAHSPDNISAH